MSGVCLDINSPVCCVIKCMCQLSLVCLDINEC